MGRLRAVAQTISFGACIIFFMLYFLILNSNLIYLCNYQQNTPVIVTFSEKSTYVYEIPFPTVTICTDIKIRRTNFDYTHVWQQLNDKNKYKKFPNVSDVEKLYVLQPLCNDAPKYLDEYVKLNRLKAKLADADERFWSLAKRYAPTLKDIISNCSWRRDPYNCSDLFHEVLTDEGICFSFNLQNASELYKEDMLHKHYHVTRHNKSSYYWNERIPPNMTEDMIYPRRVYVGSEGLRFELILNRKDKDFVCSGPVQSFKIQISSSDDQPHMHRNFYRIPMLHDIVMSVHPNIMNSNEQLDSIELEKRQCANVKKDNRQLHTLKKYTQRNCQLDELLYRQNDSCNCVAYWIPRLYNHTICRSAKDLKCIEPIESDAVIKNWNGSQISFNCLPACRSISYDAEISMAEYELDEYEFQTKNKQPSGRKDILRSRVLITFKDDQFLASRRAEMYTKIDFIANCGGILGLFMGFSILSIVEMVYFSTLRIGCSLRKRRQVKKRRLKHLKIIDELNGGGNVHEGSPHHSEYDNVPKMTY